MAPIPSPTERPSAGYPSQPGLPQARSTSRTNPPLKRPLDVRARKGGPSHRGPMASPGYGPSALAGPVRPPLRARTPRRCHAAQTGSRGPLLLPPARRSPAQAPPGLPEPRNPPSWRGGPGPVPQGARGRYLSCVFIILGGSARRGLCAAPPPPVGPADVPGCCGLALGLGPLRAQAARQLLPLRAPSSD